jgi:hypothetical protein
MIYGATGFSCEACDEGIVTGDLTENAAWHGLAISTDNAV